MGSHTLQMIKNILWVLAINVMLFFMAFNVNAQGTGSSPNCMTQVDLNTWIQEGDISRGDWNVSASGDQVIQTANKRETFFVSPDSFLNVVIHGSFKTTDDDDDFMGFVFGYKGPVGNTSDYDFYLFDWKKSYQNSGIRGAVAYEGFSLSKVTGDYSQNGGCYSAPKYTCDSTAKYFWNHISQKINGDYKFELIDSDYGSDKGYSRNTWYDFTLEYTSTRVIIKIDNDTIFNVPGCYDAGRFGFYNLSQPDVYYRDFYYQMKSDFLMSGDTICEGEILNFL